MFKKVLFLSVSLLFVSGCLPAIDESGGGSSMLSLDMNDPQAGTITDMELSFQSLKSEPECQIPTKTAPGNSKTISVNIKNDCIKEGGYNITLSLRRNGKPCSSTVSIGPGTPITNNTIDINFRLSCKGGGSMEISSDTNNPDISVNANASFEDDDTSNQTYNQNSTNSSSELHMFKTYDEVFGNRQ